MSNRSAVHPPLEALSWKVLRDWRRLDHVMQGIFDCPHSTPKLTETGPYVVRSQDIRTGVVRVEQMARVSEETYLDRVARAEPVRGDVLYSREGTYFGIAAEIPAGIKVCLGQRMVLLRPDPAKVHPTFLRLWLNSGVMERHLSGFRDGSVAERLNMPTIRALPVPHIPLREQQAIACLLGALDDKIELNRRMNETLEAMARAIFKDWFVDFGPTRSKMEGRPPYLSADLWSLFPDRLDDDGKPAGWTTWTVSEMACLHTDGLWPSSSPETEYELFSIPAYDADRQPEVIKGRYIKSNKTLVPRNSLLLSKLNPEIPRVWLPKLAADHVQICSTELLVFTPRRGLGRGLLYCIFCSPDYRQRLLSMVTGTSKSHQRVSPKSLLNCHAAIGAADAFSSFEQLASEMLERILANHAESNTLAATRDLLLPKLMSGEIRLRDAEKAVEAAL